MLKVVVHADAAREAPLTVERAILREAEAELVGGGATDEEEIIAAASGAQVLLTDSAAITRRVLERLPACQAVVAYGIGYDHIDARAASDLGIFVVNIPGFCVEEVANHALMFILACSRNVFKHDGDMRAGKWPDSRDWAFNLPPTGSIYDQCLGLVGFGNIARSVTRKAVAFGMNVVAYDPLVSQGAFAEYNVRQMELDELLEVSDYVSVHAPLTATTRHLIGEKRLQCMQRSAFLINTSRGALVDQAALILALQEKRIAGAALDVFEQEPLPADSPLLALDNVILTPHVAGYSEASYRRLRQRVAEQAARVIRGQVPTTAVNAEIIGNSRLERARQ